MQRLLRAWATALNQADRIQAGMPESPGVDKPEGVYEVRLSATLADRLAKELLLMADEVEGHGGSTWWLTDELEAAIEALHG